VASLGEVSRGRDNKSRSNASMVMSCIAKKPFHETHQSTNFGYGFSRRVLTHSLLNAAS
jgi:hypothetical protein